MADTIFALSSGAPPAAIAIVRISGPAANVALAALAGKVPEKRRAVLRTLKDTDGLTLDRALVLWFPGPATSTGEDLTELHLHGGRAVVMAVEQALAAMDGLRRATPGEFTRRAFINGRIDLAEAEGLADLLLAETELQRRSAMAMAGGALSRQVEAWRDALLEASASIESVLDFSDEDDVAALPADFGERVAVLHGKLRQWLERPQAEVLREGFRVVLAGPPNSGKSTLFNTLVQSDAAITSEVAGTTRDVLTRTVGMEGIPFQFLDTAGLRDPTDAAVDPVEGIGVERARRTIDDADLVLWLGAEGEGPDDGWEIEARCDLSGRACKERPRHVLSAVTGQGVDGLRSDLVIAARASMPRPGEAALNERQVRLLGAAGRAIASSALQDDPLLAAEDLRIARAAFDALLGHTTTEDMLDTLFGRFCIGK
ncbi:MAG: tRNA uridine-5-carboxymethylaminomethyl(34) synthesis GTPase MnmE [Sphingomonadaceae bacterium]|nr:tRNA uridine-5-carboxymethylaminomethyl(34) synthesis GTPase MnmE [Sphingomonadaceae bacterium]